MGSLNKSGSIDWTMGKLISVILLAVFLGLVLYGLATNTLMPLVERVGGVANNVLIMFKLKSENPAALIKTAMILGEEREIIFNLKDRSCEVRIMDSKEGIDDIYKYSVKGAVFDILDGSSGGWKTALVLTDEELNLRDIYLPMRKKKQEGIVPLYSVPLAAESDRWMLVGQGLYLDPSIYWDSDIKGTNPRYRYDGSFVWTRVDNEDWEKDLALGQVIEEGLYEILKQDINKVNVSGMLYKMNITSIGGDLVLTIDVGRVTYAIDATSTFYIRKEPGQRFQTGWDRKDSERDGYLYFDADWERALRNRAVLAVMKEVCV
jgi:hypothetical protein